MDSLEWQTNQTTDQYTANCKQTRDHLTVQAASVRLIRMLAGKFRFTNYAGAA